MNKILEVLKESGRSQVWLAKQIGKSYNMTNSYVKNRRQPSIETLFKIADSLDVKPHSLINGSMTKNDLKQILLDLMTFAIDAEREPQHATKELIVDKFILNNALVL